MVSFQGEEVACIVGEKLQRMSRDVTFLCPFSGPIKGNLYLTNYKLFFSNKDRSSTSTLASFEVPLGLVRIKLKILFGILQFGTFLRTLLLM